MEFLQTKEWAELESSLGNECYWPDEVLVIKKSLPLHKCWLYVPRLDKQTDDEFCQKLISLARIQKAIFIKIEPSAENLLPEPFIEKGKKGKTLQPGSTLIMDLTASEEELLAKMKPKTRYNIRLARNKGVIVVKNPEGAIDNFCRLTRETAKRNKIITLPNIRFQKMWEILNERHNLLSIYEARYHKHILAGIMVLQMGKSAWYLHGASANIGRNLMAPYLLQWEAICEAKKTGVQKYDFWGAKVKFKTLAVDNDHDWAGITRFKLGFTPNGEIVTYPLAIDIILSPLYYYGYNFAINLKKQIKKYVGKI